MVYCQRCGAENQNEARFCKQCGASLSIFVPGDVDVHQDKRGGTSLDVRKLPGEGELVAVKSEALRGKVHRKHRKELGKMAKVERKRLNLILKIDKRIGKLRWKLAKDSNNEQLRREIDALIAHKRELEESVHRGTY